LSGIFKINFKNIVSRFRLGQERESAEYITEQVTTGIEFRGTNLIILIFAIFIAGSRGMVKNEIRCR